MSFLSPTAALVAAGLTVPVLVALYFLKRRRREVTVASTLLWRQALADLEVNAPFQRLRRNLLLLLQLAVLAGLLVALARPTLRSPARAGERLVIVLDQSASMNATDIPPTRLDHAKALALRLVEDFQGAGGAMVVSFGQQARVVQPFTTDRDLLRAAIAAIRPTDGGSRLGPALELIEPYGAGAAGAGPEGALAVYVFSDGRVTDTRDLSLRGGVVRFVRVASDTAAGPDNLAIVGLAARRDLARPARVQVLARLGNYGPRPVAANVTLRVDGQVRGVTAVVLPGLAAAAPHAAEEVVQFAVELPGAALVTVAHDHRDDLPADDSAALVLAPPQPVRVLLVTTGNAYVQRMLAAAGVGVLVAMPPAQYEQQDPRRLRRAPGIPGTPGSAAGGSGGSGGVDGFDLIVFDEYSPRQVPVVDSLYLGGTPPIPGLARVPSAAGGARTQVVLDWRRDHPLLRYAALDDLVLAEPGRLVLPEGATVLAIAQAGPVMADVAVQGVRHVVTSFSVLRSNWPMQVSFAVFISNAVQTLGLGTSGGAGLAFRPGAVAVVPTAADAAQVTYTGPATLQAAADQGRAVLPMFERAGVYRAAGGVAPPWDQIAVNLTDPAESDLRPAAALAVGSAAVAPGQPTGSVPREVWPWAVWAALGVLVVEWLVWVRRTHL